MKEETSGERSRTMREGIDMKAPIPQELNVVLLEFLNDYDKYKSVPDGLSADFVLLDEYIAKAITGIMVGLHSQGVVIKVDRGYIDCDGIGSMGVMSKDCVLLKAGYVPVVSLIEPAVELIKEERW